MAHNIAPCKGCSDRHTACHGHCTKYAEWKAEVQKENESLREHNRRAYEDFLHSEQCFSAREKWRLRKKYGRK